MDKQITKIVVFGALDAGKTTFVEVLSGEKLLLKGEHGRITTSFDFVQIDYKNYLIQLFATPGHRRFSFMWDTLARGMECAIFLIDSTVGISPVDYELLLFIKKYEVPYIIAANKSDLVNIPEDEIRKKLEIPDEVPVVYTSALTNQNLDHVMDTAISLINDYSNKGKGEIYV